jgi:hypothetical protein
MFDFVPTYLTSAEGLGTVYLAEPVCDDVNATFPLELYTVSFDSPYYSTSQGVHTNLLSSFLRFFMRKNRKEEAKTSGN